MLDGVADEVTEGTQEQVGVAGDEEVFGDAVFDPDFGGELFNVSGCLGLFAVDGFFQDGADRDGLQFDGGGAEGGFGEGEEFGDEGGDLLGFFGGDLKEVCGFCVGGGGGREQGRGLGCRAFGVGVGLAVGASGTFSLSLS